MGGGLTLQFVRRVVGGGKSSAVGVFATEEGIGVVIHEGMG